MNKKKFFKLTPFRISVIATFFVIILYLFSLKFPSLYLFRVIEEKLLDSRFIVRGAEKPDPEVVIVAIDEKSLASPELGRWPWPRSKIAEFINLMKKYKPAVIAFDIVFSEPDKNSELVKVKEFKKLFNEMKLNQWPLSPEKVEKQLEELKKRMKEIQDTISLLGRRMRRLYLKKATLKIVAQMKELTDELAEVNTKIKLLEEVSENSARFYRYILESEIKANNDYFLARALKEGPPSVLGYFFYFSKREASHLSPIELKEREKLIENSRIKIVLLPHSRYVPWVPVAYGVNPNIPILSRAVKYQGFFNMIPDLDGEVRWHPMLVTLHGRDDYYPSLSLITAAVYLHRDIVLKIGDEGEVSLLAIGKRRIPVNESGKLLINYRGPPGTFKTYSFVDVLDGKVPPSEFKNKIVLVGATAIGIYDLRNTPFGAEFPGVEVHANVISNILNGDFLVRPAWMIFVDLAIVLFLGLLLGIILSPLSALMNLIVTIVVFAGYNIFAQWVFESQRLWVSSLYPDMTILFVFVGVVIFKYLTEEKSKKEIKNAFQQYVSHHVVNEILKDPSKLKLGGERRVVTVMFSDIRGFTSISESLSPTELVTLLNSYLTPMTDIVLKHEGTLDKFIGDAIMAFFGAPLEQKDHASRACRAAIEMKHKLAELNREWQKKGWPEIRIGIGINSGEVAVGNMGSQSRFDYTVMGDNVNLASRLEGTNKVYGTTIIISEFTYMMIEREEFFYRELDYVRVKGKKKPVRIFELIDFSDKIDDVQRRVKELFEKGLEEYRRGGFERALKYFEMVLEIKDDPPSKVFVERCRDLIVNPPSEWDGVYTMKTK